MKVPTGPNPTVNKMKTEIITTREVTVTIKTITPEETTEIMIMEGTKVDISRSKTTTETMSTMEGDSTHQWLNRHITLRKR